MGGWSGICKLPHKGDATSTSEPGGGALSGDGFHLLAPFGCPTEPLRASCGRSLVCMHMGSIAHGVAFFVSKKRAMNLWTTGQNDTHSIVSTVAPANRLLVHARGQGLQGLEICSMWMPTT